MIPRSFPPGGRGELKNFFGGGGNYWKITVEIIRGITVGRPLVLGLKREFIASHIVHRNPKRNFVVDRYRDFLRTEPIALLNAPKMSLPKPKLPKTKSTKVPKSKSTKVLKLPKRLKYFSNSLFFQNFIKNRTGNKGFTRRSHRGRGGG